MDPMPPTECQILDPKQSHKLRVQKFLLRSTVFNKWQMHQPGFNQFAFASNRSNKSKLMRWYQVIWFKKIFCFFCNFLNHLEQASLVSLNKKFTQSFKQVGGYWLMSYAIDVGATSDLTAEAVLQNLLHDKVSLTYIYTNKYKTP